MPKKLQKLTEGDLHLSLRLSFMADPESNRVSHDFEVVCDPETMTVKLYEDMADLTESLDPNEDAMAAAEKVCNAIQGAGFDMTDMKRHIAPLLIGLVNATP